MLSIDAPEIIRPDQSLDLARLSQYLRTRIAGLTGEIEVAQFPSGHSNLTYLLTCGNLELVIKREPPGSKAKSAHDMGREYRILSKLHGRYPLAPAVFDYCEDDSVIGGKFCTMERLRGVIIRRAYPEDGSVLPAQIRTQFNTLIDALAGLHLLNVEETGLASFGKPEGYRKRQLDGWCRRLSDAKTQDLVDFDEITSWLYRRLPNGPDEAAIVHNDFKIDNLVWMPSDITKLIGVLDWEMATVGDPLMDLACTLSFWIEKDDPPEFRALRGMPTTRPEAPSRAEAIARYLELAKRTAGDQDFYLCFGFFRRAIIEQQKYFRYSHGHSRDARFADLHRAVGVLRDMCLRVIRGGAGQ
jgi:aminoglycoside phosphotransferase (APT) family kinase protein